MIKKTRIKMAELNPGERIKSFDEVASGYTAAEAVSEAERCIQCKKPQCIAGCPVEVDIPGFIKKIAEKEFGQAVKILKDKNNLPAICGRVCPQETQCEIKCVLGKKSTPSAIGALERFAADCEINDKEKSSAVSQPGVSDIKKVAVVGSGPAGLTCAGDLARMGYKVTIFEALHDTGGVLRYGIPSFRLPRNILDYEINYVKSLGVEIKCNTIIGKIYSISELFDMGYKSIFVGSGAGLPVFPRIEGENLCRIYSANEFLTRINLMHANKFPEYDTPINIGKKVAVIGGGNTAMDSARSALRLLMMSGSLKDKSVSLVYRRTEHEMPAREAEVEHAKEEGVNFMFLTQPLAFIGDEKGFVKGMKCIKCELGEPDSSGRRRPVPIKGSEFILDVDTAVLAIGLKPNPIIPMVTRGIKTNARGEIIVNPETMETSLKGVYAGGDIACPEGSQAGGEGTVIEAMGMGKKAASAIDKQQKK
jgi:glutamate synthase (NADPH/NADH) small chain